MQPATISGPKAASGPVNGLNSPTTSVDPGELPPPWVLPLAWELPLPEELQAATDRSASAAAAASAVGASLIKHLFDDEPSAPRRTPGLSGFPAGQQRDGLDFYQCLWDGERADLHQRARRPGVAEVAAAHRVDGQPVGYVQQVDPDAHDVVEGGTGGPQDVTHVVKHLFRLPYHVAGAYNVSVDVERQHTRHVEEPARLDPVGVVADGLRQLPGQADSPHEGSRDGSRMRIMSGLG